MKNGKNRENPCMLLQREPKLREPLTVYAGLMQPAFPDIIILDARAIDREYVVPATPGS